MSARTLRVILIVLTVAGVGVASYLTYVHYSGIKVLCTGHGSCAKVQTSQYSKLAGIPVALGVTEFNFMGGSMGSVVGEELARLIEFAAEKKMALILVSGSGGGARMPENSSVSDHCRATRASPHKRPRRPSAPRVRPRAETFRGRRAGEKRPRAPAE